MNSVGEWFWDPNVIETMVSRHFTTLFSTSLLSSNDVVCSHVCTNFLRPLSTLDKSHLDWPPSLLDVRQSLFSLKPLKAPGPDGFHPVFFPEMLEHCLGLFSPCFLPKCFFFCKIDPRINKTLLCLIPKVDNPQNITQFRPISLCNTLYKIITKTIVNRMRGILPSLISPYQGSFIPGKCTTDSVIIVQEVIHV